MSESFARLLGTGARALVDASSARPRWVVAVCAVLTVASITLAATSLEIDTDSDRLLASNTTVGQTNRALAKVFPKLQNNLIVMIDADEASDARDAAEELSLRLAAQPGRFEDIFLPGDSPYYDDFGLYYLEREDLDQVAERIENAGPLLAALLERPELPILLGALSHVVGDIDGLAALGDDGADILDRFSRCVEGFNDGGHAPVAWEDMLFDDIDADHLNPQILMVRPVGDLTQLAPVLDAITLIRTMGTQLTPRAGLRVRVTGERAVHSEEMTLVVGEAIVSAIVSLVLVAVILFVCLRSGKLVVGTVLTLLAGLSWTAGVAALAVGQLNVLTSAFAVVYIGLAVDFGIHFGLSYLEQRSKDRPTLQALEITATNTGSSLFLCALTTAIGFYAFIPTDYTAVADMGIISGTGVLLGLLATLTLFPALIALGLGESRKQAQHVLHAPRRLRLRLPSFPIRYPRSVCFVAGAVTIASCASLGAIRFDTNPLNVRDPRVESVKALRALLLDGERSAWTNEVLARDLDEARQVAAELEQLEGIHHVNTLASFLPEDQELRLAIFEQMRSDLTAPVELSDEESGEGLDRLKAIDYTIESYGVALDLDAELGGASPDEDPVVRSAERLRKAFMVFNQRLRDDPQLDVDVLETDLFGELPELFESVIDKLPTRTVTLADLPEDLSSRYVAPGGQARVEIFSDTDLAQPGAIERFTDLVLSVRADAGGAAAGSVALGRDIFAALRQALATAIVVIAIVLMLLLRSLKYAALTLAPLLIGAVATAAVSVAADIPLNFANVIVLPLILGVGVDSGIHLVNRHRKGHGAENLLHTSTASAVFFSALTTGASFATLALSNHLGISSLAQMLTIGIGMMLAANVIVLPAILTVVDGVAAEGLAREPLAKDPIPGIAAD